MTTVRVYSKNADYQRFEVLKTNRNKRHRMGEFFVEGVRSINRAVADGWEIASFLYAGERELSTWARDLLRTVPTRQNYELSPALMEEISSKVETSELCALVRMRTDGPKSLTLSERPLLALFDRPSNKGNLGTVIRSCDAMGVEALLLTGHAVDPYDSDVIAATMGSFFKVPVVQMGENEATLAYLDGLRERYPGFQAVGTTAHREAPIETVDLTQPIIFFLGNETDGLCRAFRDYCDVMATIPMAEGSYASSFNVACAASILFYEAARQRRQI